MPGVRRLYPAGPALSLILLPCAGFWPVVCPAPPCGGGYLLLGGNPPGVDAFRAIPDMAVGGASVKMPAGYVLAGRGISTAGIPACCGWGLHSAGWPRAGVRAGGAGPSLSRFCGQAGLLCWSCRAEVRPGVEVVLAGLVHDAQQAVLFGRVVGQAFVDLVHLKGRGVPPFLTRVMRSAFIGLVSGCALSWFPSVPCRALRTRIFRRARLYHPAG